MNQPTDYSALSDRDLQFLQMGRATVIPGYQRAMEMIEAELNQMKEEMYHIQNVRTSRAAANSNVEIVSVRKSLLRAAGPGSGKTNKLPARGNVRDYWARMTPEERSVEMRRRMALGEAKRAAKLHPRDKGHPEHERWRAKMAKAHKKRWASLSPREQKSQMKVLAAARQAQRLPKVTLGKTA